MSDARLLLATPVRAAELGTAQVSLGYSDFRVRLAWLMPHDELVGHASFSLDVVRGRNRMVGLLLSEPAFAAVTHVLWVDDDQWPDDVRIVPEMIAACTGVLGAPYTNKRTPMRWVHREDGAGGFAGVGFGFTMTTRACLEAVARDAHWYVDLPQSLRVPNIFGQLYETTPLGETLLSEDFSFCRRARDAGYLIELYGGAGIIRHAGGHAWSAHDMPGGVIG